MNSLHELFFALEKIVFELKKNGKSESSSFFALRYEALKKYNNRAPYNVIEELSTCKAISQYANFSLKEEGLLDAVVDSAIAVKNTAP